ncbi:MULTISPECIES: pantoate--beta-alanine ligase [Shewanella]|jgi:pantoate--beta-alanine ligase|uniref:Pantothenate synthetase n=1 Tax=Shewanella indica TaxID=768528 RepID=A0ABU4QCW7_9GAMM|nr:MULTISPECIES: pantoate--beta-alanine ligase [Shewanella]OIN16745.1 pantoate--beta-alanine ligase [Shewanella algae]MCE9792102.1 pantoate--beta-alanine ligase [Shewanella indica]MDX6015191.1 pantoate--beta-alanine ligase [Shewanella indica]NDO74865.1 pantoate--beta-alanine ligase [Shewanella sp. SE1]QWL05143.1 pantoate--beta-alanine ligase [Shewanella indica]
MLTTAKIDEIRARVREWRQKGETIAFVPTMGNLHQGHVSLILEAARRADHVVASIFVNPLQFGKNEDLDAYPRTLGADQQKLTEAGCELLFTPTPELIYPKGLDAQTFVEVPGISDELCGASRPGHFRGVATIVCKLFNIVQPDIALFGRKDYQQLLVIKTMVTDLSLPIEVIGVETVREDSGLALSSRNGYLTEAEKALAPKLKASMDKLAEAIVLGQDIDQAISNAKEFLRAAGLEPDYLEVREASSLKPVNSDDKSLVILAAAYLGKARLIDNMILSR